MTVLHHQVRIARNRLWINRWLVLCGVWLSGAALLWTITLILHRLRALGLPLTLLAEAGVVITLIGATVHFLFTRDPDERAAVALDQAAGLKERVATALSLRDIADDPFAAAVVADAEQVVGSLTPRRFIPLRWPRTMTLGTAMMFVALLSLLLPEFDLLKKKEARANHQAKQEQLAQVRNAVAKPMAVMQKLTETQGDSSMDQELKALEETLKKDGDAESLRRATAKQLDRLEDVLKDKADGDRFKALKETKNRLRNMGQAEDPRSDLGALMDRLSQGDFEQAQKQLQKTQEQLAKLMKDPKSNSEQLEKMKKQLDELSKKLQQAAEDKKSERELKNAGLTDKDIQRALDTLAKKDPQQLEKLAKELADRLKDKGMTKEQMEKLLNKIAQNQEAKKQLEKMAGKMAQAARRMEQSDSQAAQDELQEAQEQLSELEQMEQSLNELEGQLAELEGARNDLNGEKDDDYNDGQCTACGGSGFKNNGAPCAKCNGTGQCNGRGRGSGPRDRDDSGDFGFVNKKDKTQPQKGGAIISQEFVKGRQLLNQSQAELIESARAAEIDATDSLNRERIPPAYRRGVRAYFDRLGDQIKTTDSSDKPPPTDKNKAAADKP